MLEICASDCCSLQNWLQKKNQTKEGEGENYVASPCFQEKPNFRCSFKYRRFAKSIVICDLKYINL